MDQKKKKRRNAVGVIDAASQNNAQEQVVLDS
jgi:hypothetical protein